MESVGVGRDMQPKIAAEITAACRIFGRHSSALRQLLALPLLETLINQQFGYAQRLGMAGALPNPIMLTLIQDIRQENIPQAAMPACTREEAARLLDSLWCDYQWLSLRARSQVKILMSALTNVQFSSEPR